MYVTFNGLVDIPICVDLLFCFLLTLEVTLRDFANYLQGHCMCSYHSFITETIKIWSSLPSLVIDCHTLDQFKHTQLS